MIYNETNLKRSLNINDNSELAIIFCTKNCESTIENAITKVKQSQYNPDIIVVDGFSTDNTIKIAKKIEGITIIEQPIKKFPGKGIAMRAGLEEVVLKNQKYLNQSNNTTNNNNTTNKKYKAALFLDADIINLSREWVDSLADPVMKGGYDMTRGFYDRYPSDAAVTKLIAYPMLGAFFPEVSHFEQPLSGEVCANMRVWETLLKDKNGNKLLPDGWGIDVWFLIEAAMNSYKIKEIYMGRKNHTSFEEYKDDVMKLKKMAEQVAFTIIDQSIRHNRLEEYKKVML